VTQAERARALFALAACEGAVDLTAAINAMLDAVLSDPRAEVIQRALALRASARPSIRQALELAAAVCDLANLLAERVEENM
jgi:hypothetical protein